MNPSDGFLTDFLKKSAVPAIAAFFLGTVALLIEQIYLDAFGLDLAVLGSQTDTASLLIKNSGYLLGWVPLMLIFISAGIVALQILIVISILFGVSIYEMAKYIWYVIIGELFLIVTGQNTTKDGIIALSGTKYFNSFRNIIAKYIEQNKNFIVGAAAIIRLHWQAAVVSLTVLAIGTAVLTAIVRANELHACARNADTGAVVPKGDDRAEPFCRTFYSRFLGDRLGYIFELIVRRPRIATLVFESDAPFSGSIDIAPRPADCRKVGDNDSCAIVAAHSSARMLHLVNHGEQALFYTLGPNGRPVILRMSDIAALAYADLSYGPSSTRSGDAAAMNGVLQLGEREIAAAEAFVAKLPTPAPTDAPELRARIDRVELELGRTEQEIRADIDIVRREYSGADAQLRQEIAKVGAESDNDDAAIRTDIQAASGEIGTVIARVDVLDTKLERYEEILRTDISAKVDVNLKLDGASVDPQDGTININLQGSPASLPDEWTGVPPKIRQLCGTEDLFVSAPLGFQRGAIVANRDATREWLGKFLDGLDEKLKSQSDPEAYWILRVEGSADSTGSAMANLTVAERRAAHVHALIERAIQAHAVNAHLASDGDNWEIVSFGRGESFGLNAAGLDADARSPRHVVVRLCKRKGESASR